MLPVHLQKHLPSGINRVMIRYSDVIMYCIHTPKTSSPLLAAFINSNMSSVGSVAVSLVMSKNRFCWCGIIENCLLLQENVDKELKEEEEKSNFVRFK